MKSLRQVWDWSHTPAVRDFSVTKIGNRKKRLRFYASFPDQQPSVSIVLPYFAIACKFEMSHLPAVRTSVTR